MGQIRKIKKIWGNLGPGFITGAADDDPSGIATYSQAGAQFGLSLLWLSGISFPLMATVQEMCARIGIVTGRGLASNIKRHFPRPVLYFLTLLVFSANTLNLGANLGAMAQAIQLLAPQIGFEILVVFFGIFSLVLQIFLSYKTYSRYLKWLALILLAYIFAALAVPGTNWGEVVVKAVIPQFELTKETLVMICAILGTTISPYLFFWQTSQEVEQEISEGNTSILSRKNAASPRRLTFMRRDVWFGMFLSNAIMFFIIAATALTLFQNGITNINSAADAAEALRPFLGDFAYIAFSLGIIGTGLLSIPVLAGAASYAVAESFGFTEGLSKQWYQAIPFYIVIGISIGIGILINFLGIDVIKSLIFSALLNGIVAPFILAAIVIISSNKKVMGQSVNNIFTKIVGWGTTLVMAVSGIVALIALI